jgi:hypothetical protein
LSALVATKIQNYKLIIQICFDHRETEEEGAADGGV